MAACARARNRFIAVRKFREVVGEPVGRDAAAPGLRTAACFKFATAALSAATLSASVGGFLFGSGRNAGSSTVAS